jgi:hypothetical protein
VPGASTSVAVYDDRMEIINPGDLHYFVPMTPGPGTPSSPACFIGRALSKNGGQGH